MRVSRSYQIREAMLPGPVQTSGYRTVVLVGATGSGKTSLVRQLIGVEGPEERFPAVSAAKTTVAETEVLLAPGDYYTVVTFRAHEDVWLLVAECLDAALGALVNDRPEAEAERALLVHHQQRFHLHYLLGPAEGTGVVDLRGARWIGEVLDGLRRLIDEQVGAGWSADRLWTAPAFAAAVDEVVEEISRRVDRLPAGTLRRGEDGWPTTWHATSSDRDGLLDVLGLFAGNDSRRYGRLVTPLVDGLRVRGPFRPLGVVEVPYLLVVDTEGLGHTPASAGGYRPDRWRAASGPTGSWSSTTRASRCRPPPSRAPPTGRRRADRQAAARLHPRRPVAGAEPPLGRCAPGLPAILPGSGGGAPGVECEPRPPRPPRAGPPARRAHVLLRRAWRAARRRGTRERCPVRGYATRGGSAGGRSAARLPHP